MKSTMSNKRPTYVITGASGFVGGALAAKLLHDGNKVLCLLRDGYAPSGATIVRGDLSSYEDCCRLISKAGPDCRVFHLGAQAKVQYANNNRLETFESNVRGTYNLLEAIDRHAPFAPVVVASSDKAYGDLCVDEDSYNESHRLQGKGFYDVSKSCTDLIAQTYAWNGLELSIVRCGNIYGPTDTDLSRVVPSIAKDLSRGVDPIIHSDGTPIRDYIYIGDAVRAYIALMEELVTNPLKCRAQAYNFSGGEELTVLQLAERMIEICKRGRPNWTAKPQIMGTRTGEIQRQVLDCNKARTELDWKPITDLNEGLLLTLRWWYENPSL